MTYKQALILSSRDALSDTARAIIDGHDDIIWLEMIAKISKPIKRYLAHPKQAEAKAIELGVFAIKDVDAYLKTLKEVK